MNSDLEIKKLNYFSLSESKINKLTKEAKGKEAPVLLQQPKFEKEIEKQMELENREASPDSQRKSQKADRNFKSLIKSLESNQINYQIIDLPLPTDRKDSLEEWTASDKIKFAASISLITVFIPIGYLLKKIGLETIRLKIMSKITLGPTKNALRQSAEESLGLLQSKAKLIEAETQKKPIVIVQKGIPIKN